MSDNGSVYTCRNHETLRWFDTKPGGRLVFSGEMPTESCPTGKPDMAGGMPPFRTLVARMQGYNVYGGESMKEDPSITSFADVKKFVAAVEKMEQRWAFECECPASDMVKLDEQYEDACGKIKLADD